MMDGLKKPVANDRNEAAMTAGELVEYSSETMFGSISMSAASLARDAVSQPVAQSATQALASLAAGTEKGESSSNSAELARLTSNVQSSSLHILNPDSIPASTSSSTLGQSFRSESRISVDDSRSARYDFDAFLAGKNIPSFDDAPSAIMFEDQYPIPAEQQ